MPEELDYAPRIVLPSEGELSPSEINQLISTATTLRKIDQESRAAARRYRGQQQLQQLIQQGVPMEKAMMQVSGDLFYQQPEHLTPMLRQFEIDRRTEERQRAADARFQQLMNFRERQAAMKVPPLTPEQKATATAASRKATQDFSIWKTEHSAAVERLKTEKNKLDSFLAQNATTISDPKNQPTVDRYLKNVETANKDLREILKRRPTISPTVTAPADEDETEEPDMTDPVLPSAPLVPPSPANFRIPTSTPSIVHPDTVPPGPVARPTGRVRVKSPAGKVGHVPAEQVDQALKEGYSLLE